MIENAEELSFDVPGIFKSFGILLGHLVASGVFTVLEILDLTSVLACGSNPSSCKVLGEVLKNFYIESGEEAVVSSTSFDELKRMWVDGQVDQETYAAWLDRYELEFLKFSDGATSGEGANDWISELKKSVGDIPVGDILKNLEVIRKIKPRDDLETDCFWNCILNLRIFCFFY